MKDKKFKYTSLSNLCFIYKNLWEYDKSIVLFAAAEVIFAVISGFGAVLLPSVIIGMLEKHISVAVMIRNIVIICALYGGINAVSSFLRDRNEYQYIEFRTGFMTEIQYRKMMNMDYDIFEDEKTQKLLKAGDEALANNHGGLEGILHNMVLISTEVIGLILYALLLTNVHPLIIVLLTVISCIQFICFHFANKYELKNKDKKAEAEITKQYLDRQANDVVAGKDIRLYQMKNWLTLKYRKANMKYQKLIEKERLRYFANDLIGLFLQLIRDAICYGYLIMMLKNGSMSVSQFVLYIGLVSSFAEYFNQITRNITETERCQKSVCFFRKFLDIDNHNNHGSITKTQFCDNAFEIEFSHVTFCYQDSEKKILNDISFTLRKGEKAALVGINGAGKTTIVKLICGFYHPTEGHIYVNGTDISELDLYVYYDNIAAVFQDAFSFSFTVAENVTCLSEGKYDEEKCVKSIKRAGLWEKIKELPDKEKTYLNKDIAESGIQLSGGQMQKLMLARALYKNCKLLLLDEPTAALDAIAENEMYEKYEEVISGRTALFISHRLASTRFCDKILFLENGRIVEEGTHEELLAANKEYAHMFEVQSQYYKEGGKENAD